LTHAIPGHGTKILFQAACHPFAACIQSPFLFFTSSSADQPDIIAYFSIFFNVLNSGMMPDNYTGL
jgi:hypothetical protein